MAGIPTCTSLTPTTLTAKGGLTTLTGVNYNTAAVTAVTVNGSVAAFTITSDTALAVTVPPIDPSALGFASIAVTNPSGTLTDATKLTITAYVVPTVTSGTGTTKNNTITPTGHFDTLGTIFATPSLANQYKQFESGVWSSTKADYPNYLARVAKVKAILLNNQRHPTALITVAAF